MQELYGIIYLYQDSHEVNYIINPSEYCEITGRSIVEAVGTEKTYQVDSSAVKWEVNLKEIKEIKIIYISYDLKDFLEGKFNTNKWELSFSFPKELKYLDLENGTICDNLAPAYVIFEDDSFKILKTGPVTLNEAKDYIAERVEKIREEISEKIREEISEEFGGDVDDLDSLKDDIEEQQDLVDELKANLENSHIASGFNYYNDDWGYDSDSTDVDSLEEEEYKLKEMESRYSELEDQSDEIEEEWGNKIDNIVDSFENDFDDDEFPLRAELIIGVDEKDTSTYHWEIIPGENYTIFSSDDTEYRQIVQNNELPRVLYEKGEGPGTPFDECSFTTLDEADDKEIELLFNN